MLYFVIGIIGFTLGAFFGIGIHRKKNTAPSTTTIDLPSNCVLLFSPTNQVRVSTESSFPVDQSPLIWTLPTHTTSFTFEKEGSLLCKSARRSDISYTITISLQKNPQLIERFLQTHSQNDAEDANYIHTLLSSFHNQIRTLFHSKSTTHWQENPTQLEEQIQQRYEQNLVGWEIRVALDQFTETALEHYNQDNLQEQEVLLVYQHKQHNIQELQQKLATIHRTIQKISHDNQQCQAEQEKLQQFEQQVYQQYQKVQKYVTDTTLAVQTDLEEFKQNIRNRFEQVRQEYPKEMWLSQTQEYAQQQEPILRNNWDSTIEQSQIEAHITMTRIAEKNDPTSTTSPSESTP